MCYLCFLSFYLSSGLLENADNTKHEPQCCDVRWELKFNECSHSTFKRTHPSRQHTSATTSGAPRLSQGRLKLCLLVLVLLHTVATMTAVQNSTCLAAIFPLEDNAPREEWQDAGLALANQHTPKSERWPARNWAKPIRTKHDRHAGRSLAALYMFSALYAPGRRNDRIQQKGKKRRRKRKTKAVSFWDALRLFWKVYILLLFFFLYQMIVRLFPFLASAVEMGFCVCQPLQIKNGMREESKGICIHVSVKPIYSISYSIVFTVDS